MGVLKEHFSDGIDPDVERAVTHAATILEGLGATVDEVSTPVARHTFAILGTILFAEAAEIHRDHLRNRADDIGQDVRTSLETGSLIPAIDYVRAQRARTAFNREFAKTLKRFEVLLAPTTPTAAPKIGDEAVQIGDGTEPVPAMLPRLTRPFNICGIPTISVPCGFTASGMPIGMQLAGRAFDEATVLRVAHAYQQATDWHTRRPPL